jgi:hypothetical protein
LIIQTKWLPVWSQPPALEVTEAVIQELCDEFEFPRRSVTAKLRKLGFEVPKKPGAAPVFLGRTTEALSSFLSGNSGVILPKRLPKPL